MLCINYIDIVLTLLWSTTPHSRLPHKHKIGSQIDQQTHYAVVTPLTGLISLIGRACLIGQFDCQFHIRGKTNLKILKFPAPWVHHYD